MLDAASVFRMGGISLHLSKKSALAVERAATFPAKTVGSACVLMLPPPLSRIARLRALANAQ
jgi:hypothetical protein